jgi:hypothetical protein
MSNKDNEIRQFLVLLALAITGVFTLFGIVSVIMILTGTWGLL